MVKHFGIYIDEELNFKHHITSIAANISRGVDILYKIKIFFQPRLSCVYVTALCMHI